MQLEQPVAGYRWLPRVRQLVVACIVLGLGVALLLDVGWGSDGYSTLVNGLSIASGAPFWIPNAIVGFLLVAVAWLRGTRPGIGTIVQPLVVGSVVSVAMALIPEAESAVLRVLQLLVAFVLLTLGVAGYLASNTGAGPAEAAALAWDPPVPFKWSYSIVQGGGALTGWLLGADVGVATLLVVALLGPAVDLVRRRIPAMERNAGLALRG